MANALEQYIETLDLKVAWDRTKRDLEKSIFASYPLEDKLVDRDLEGWLNQLKQDFINGRFPKTMQICNVLKPGWRLRPGGILNLSDIVLYHAVLLALAPNINKRISWSNDKCAHAYHILEDFKSQFWFKEDREGFNNFRINSLAEIDRGANFVIFADIAGFFENIDLATLQTDLEETGGDKTHISTLRAMLSKWAHPISKGIPQGLHCSTILAELYADGIDRYLYEKNIIHHRYVDDIRIFCDTEIDARKALYHLIICLREKGLILQTEKTITLQAETARNKIEGVAPVIDEISDDLKQEWDRKNYTYLDLGYVSIEDIETLAASDDDFELQALEYAFTNYLEDSELDFNKSLFHFIINRLGKAQSRSAVVYCLDALYKHPEETKHILPYFQNIGADTQILEGICNYLLSEYAINSHQIYLIMKWARENNLFYPDLLNKAKTIFGNQNYKDWLRYECLMY